MTNKEKLLVILARLDEKVLIDTIGLCPSDIGLVRNVCAGDRCEECLERALKEVEL